MYERMAGASASKSGNIRESYPSACSARRKVGGHFYEIGNLESQGEKGLQLYFVSWSSHTWLSTWKQTSTSSDASVTTPPACVYIVLWSKIFPEWEKSIQEAHERQESVRRPLTLSSHQWRSRESSIFRSEKGDFLLPASFVFQNQTPSVTSFNDHKSHFTAVNCTLVSRLSTSFGGKSKLRFFITKVASETKIILFHAHFEFLFISYPRGNRDLFASLCNNYCQLCGGGDTQPMTHAAKPVHRHKGASHTAHSLLAIS